MDEEGQKESSVTQVLTCGTRLLELPFAEKPKSRGKASMGRWTETKFSFRHVMKEVPSRISSEM